MVVGSIDSFEQGHVPFPQAVLEALKFLRDSDFAKMKDGQYDVGTEGSFAKVQRYETCLPGNCRPEAHQKYVDIQYVYEGEEYIGWCPFSPDLKEAEAYDAEKDVAFYSALVPDSNLLLLPGCFVILYPEDVHCPKMAVDGVPGNVTKVVVKIPVDLL